MFGCFDLRVVTLCLRGLKLSDYCAYNSVSGCVLCVYGMPVCLSMYMFC